MTVESAAVLFFNHEVAFSIQDEEVLQNWILETIESEGKQLASINLIICSDTYLLQLNRQYLSHDFFTDILTFGYADDPIEGEIFISVERVKENAQERHLSISHELNRVIIHGVLHLCGYRDGDEAAKKVMTQKEDLYLDLLSSKIKG